MTRSPKGHSRIRIKFEAAARRQRGNGEATSRQKTKDYIIPPDKPAAPFLAMVPSGHVTVMSLEDPSGNQEDGNEWMFRNVLGRTGDYVAEPHMAVLN